MSGKSNKFKNKIKTYNNNNKDSKNYYLIHATYTTKPEKKYPETKCILNNFICRAIEELSFGDVYFHCFTFLRIFLNDPLFSLSLKISSSILINKEPVISFKCQFVVQSDIARECD